MRLVDVLNILNNKQEEILEGISYEDANSYRLDFCLQVFEGTWQSFSIILFCDYYAKNKFDCSGLSVKINEENTITDYVFIDSQISEIYDELSEKWFEYIKEKKGENNDTL